MKCWRCGKEISDGTRECVYCHTDQQRSEPVSVIGQAMRQLYDHYGAEAVLTNPVLLSNGLGDVIMDSLAVNLKKFKNQLRMAMDAGVGKMYLDQIQSSGKPDSDFDSRVKMILTEDVGMNDKTAAELTAYFDEMIGWQNSPKQEKDPSEKPVYKRANRLMSYGTLEDYKKALTLLETISGYDNADQLAEICRQKIKILTKSVKPPAPPSEPPKKNRTWLIVLVLVFLAAGGYLIKAMNDRQNELFASATAQVEELTRQAQIISDQQIAA